MVEGRNGHERGNATGGSADIALAMVDADALNTFRRWRPNPLATGDVWMFRHALLVLGMCFASGRATAQVLRVADLNTQQIRALDRAKTVVLLQGGMLEEHGPYLPAFTDGILSDRLTKAIAAGVIAKKPDWKVLVFPPVSVGASGGNEIGGLFRFPSTYAIRPSTLRATYMDLATELGEQGFTWIMLVNVHGSPLHIGALDDAGDFFHDTYGGQMVNLWGLLPVLGGWGSAMGIMTDVQKKDDGVSLHAGANYDEDFAVAKKPGWPGYLGAPRHASAALGKHIWDGFSAAAVKTTVEILNGTDPLTYPR